MRLFVDIVHRDLKLENILVHKTDDGNNLHIKVSSLFLVSLITYSYGIYTIDVRAGECRSSDEFF